MSVLNVTMEPDDDVAQSKPRSLGTNVSIQSLRRCGGAEIGEVNPMASTDETRTDEYRDQAAECLDSARTVADAKAKLELLALAKGYLDLADLVEVSATNAE